LQPIRAERVLAAENGVRKGVPSMRHITLIIAVIALAVAAPAIADKGGNSNGNGGGGNSGSGDSSSPKAYSPSLSVSWPLRLTSDSDTVPYVIEGCGYDASYGVVTVVVNTPVAVAWTARDPDSSGCISVSNFSTQGAGAYQIEARQQVKNRDVVVASTSFTL
jgi:hypothetical protein